jgi:hypothetical protein
MLELHVVLHADGSSLNQQVGAGGVKPSFAVTPQFPQRAGLIAPSANFHKKIRASRGKQEKSQRKNSERTRSVNATSCGRSIG